MIQYVKIKRCKLNPDACGQVYAASLVRAIDNAVYHYEVPGLGLFVFGVRADNECYPVEFVDRTQVCNNNELILSLINEILRGLGEKNLEKQKI